MVEKIEEILNFWFGPLESGFPSSDRNLLWWSGGAKNDQLIGELFGRQVHQALCDELDEWSYTPRGRLALILLLDQFTRSMFRGSAEAFSGDKKALQLCIKGWDNGCDQALEFVERTFFYMPMEHAEDMDMQDRCVTCFEQMSLEVPGVHKIHVEGWLDFAHQHREQIRRFGRFPHRNDVLQRSSTPEELAFLLKSQNRWGQ